ncbi:hypothetical protein GCM10010221_02780 [Streptomyces parvus]|nr:hypothetical protein GCM10010221_02780 [Streptomyces parvus]
MLEPGDDLRGMSVRDPHGGRHLAGGRGFRVLGDGQPHEDAECHVRESRQPHGLRVDKLHDGCKLKGWAGDGLNVPHLKVD